MVVEVPRRRTQGWWVLVVVGAIAFSTTALGGTVALALAVREGNGWLAAKGLIGIGATLLFWGWITLGAWHRIHEVPADEAVPSEAHRWGPAAMVANGVVVLIFVAMIGFALWAAFATNRDDSEVNKVRDQVELAVQRSDVTRADVLRTKAASAAWAWNATGKPRDRPDPMAAILVVPGARVVDLAVDEGHAAILIRPDKGSKCVVVDIDRDNVSSTRITDRCA